MISVYLQGGLGNQLFQIFTCISLALKQNTSFKLPLYNQNTPHSVSPTGDPRPTYWKTILQHLKPYVSHNSDSLSIKPIYREKHFHYTPLPDEQNLLLYGYFQSYQYFEKYEQTIYDMIHLNDQKEEIKKKYNYNYEYTISLHFRIGDYKLLSYHPIMDVSYYVHAIQYIFEQLENTNKRYTILYFYEEKDIQTVMNNIENIKNQLSSEINDRIVFEPIDTSIPDYEQLILMSLCCHNIIANSSFSWWGAYFNCNSEKIVCYPNIWFSDNKNEMDTMFPTEWKKIYNNN